MAEFREALKTNKKQLLTIEKLIIDAVLHLAILRKNCVDSSVVFNQICVIQKLQFQQRIFEFGKIYRIENFGLFNKLYLRYCVQFKESYLASICYYYDIIEKRKHKPHYRLEAKVLQFTYNKYLTECVHEILRKKHCEYIYEDDYYIHVKLDLKYPFSIQSLNVKLTLCDEKTEYFFTFITNLQDLCFDEFDQYWGEHIFYTNRLSHSHP